MIEVNPAYYDRIWDLTGKSPEEIERLKTELLPFLGQPCRFPDGKCYVFTAPAQAETGGEGT